MSFRVGKSSYTYERGFYASGLRSIYIETKSFNF